MGVLLDSAKAGESYGIALLQAVIALVLVSGLAFVTLRWAKQRGLGLARGKLLKVEERVPLDLRNALVVVQVDGRRLLLATSETGPARLIAELEARAPAPEPGHE